MRRIAALLAAGVLVAPAVWAQPVNVVPQVGMISSVLKSNTYTAVALALQPASSATDVFCISGSASRIVHISRIEISGTAGTAVSLPFTLLHRVSLDTGGTPATTTANPANTIGSMLSTEPTATATLISYTGNPTIVDASPTYMRTGVYSLVTTSSGVASNPLQWLFSGQVDFFDRGADIPAGKTNEQYCINLNATSISTGSLQIDIEWTEN